MKITAGLCFSLNELETNWATSLFVVWKLWFKVRVHSWPVAGYTIDPWEGGGNFCLFLHSCSFLLSLGFQIFTFPLIPEFLNTQTWTHMLSRKCLNHSDLYILSFCTIELHNISKTYKHNIITSTIHNSEDDLNHVKQYVYMRDTWMGPSGPGTKLLVISNSMCCYL